MRLDAVDSGWTVSGEEVDSNEPRIAFDGRIDGHLVVCDELHLCGGGSGDGVLGEAIGGAVEVDIVVRAGFGGGFWRGRGEMVHSGGGVVTEGK
jgi:hypothetical protein